MIDQYDWAGGREAMLRFGPDTGPVVVAALPLFEEANRTRAFVVTILRQLAERGIAGALPELPGQGESLLPTEAATLADLRAGFAAACARFDKAYAFAVRSGALLDTQAESAGRCHLVPTTGAELVRELGRLRGLNDGNNYAGNLLSPALLTELETAMPAAARTMRFEGDARAADVKLQGAPLWRRAEPDNDPALAHLLADDIAAWVRACEA
ncbi:hypothetical protein FHS95_002192 [Sphingomonas naasensis]|uniref:Uncharacterized protein n=1 Tax=Sphingomonas naasensis TaxID=1344951 RepID=A0A4V3QX05_9SPHN|nr:hypothetical protein [Sphingomonas naasensis]NIJ20500.1 hypothetical protein [Sphingomonas naasensis]TGX44592.1 hypothetical protein E5A74_07420 [Sphingomonas naasensis]